MRNLVIASLTLAGCAFEKGAASTGDAGPGSDARDGAVHQIDAAIPADAQECFGAVPFDVCVHPAPTGTVPLPVSINTGSSPLCLTQPPSGWTGQPDACFIVGNSIQVNAIVTVIGTRPLVLVAASTITITGTLDVASHLGGSIGPGSPASLSQCGAFGATPNQDSNGGGGGAGASYLTLGGDGGKGNGNNNTQGTTNNTVGAPTVLRAGCDGQQGADGSSGGNGSQPGHGGGALYLVAGTSIVLGATAVINASGSSAAAGGKASGGGGAGSGGSILFWAPAISVTGTPVVMANGGGGASGGDSNSSGHNGKAGSDPLTSAPLTPALGGNGPGGVGGTGFAGTAQAATGGNGGSNQGGGGGGGGAGYIRTNRALGTAIVTPAADLVP